MAEKVTLARIKKFGKTFEISVDSAAALKYRKGELTDLHEVLQADHIFTDAKKGLTAGSAELQQAFGTTNTNTIADLILKRGEVQETAEHRAQEREQKRKQLVYLIQRQALDARTNLPIPAERIEVALEQGKIHPDDHQTAEEQFDEIVRKLRPFLPLKIEQKKISFVVPAQYAGKLYGVVSSSSKIIKEEWKSDGGWEAMVEIPAGLYLDFIGKLNSLTHGQVVVKE